MGWAERGDEQAGVSLTGAAKQKAAPGRQAGGRAGGTPPAGHLVASQPVHISSGLLLSKYCAESSGSLSAVKETAGMIHCHKAAASSERCSSLPCLAIKQSIALGVDTEAEG